MRRVSLLALFIVLAGCAHQQPASTPLPFITASRNAFWGPSWEVSVRPDGAAEQSIAGRSQAPPASLKHVQLRPTQVAALQRAIAESSFFLLPARVGPDNFATDEDTFTLTVWQGGQEHSVAAHGLERMADSAVAARFQLVWSTLVGYVPEPRR